MAEIRQLPNTGTQKENRDLINMIVTFAWFMSVVCAVQGYGDPATIETYGVTFQSWWIAVGVNYGIYTHGESQRKKADAILNQ